MSRPTAIRPDEIEAIRRLTAEGLTRHAIALAIGRCPATISDVCRREGIRHNFSQANVASPFWQANDDILRADWSAGVPASVIGARWGVSKSTVIGRAHRLGLGFHPSGKRKVIEMPRRRPSAYERIGPLDCRWPIGHPTDVDFAFCGAPAALGRPYCAEHVKIAYQRTHEPELEAAD